MPFLLSTGIECGIFKGSTSFGAENGVVWLSHMEAVFATLFYGNFVSIGVAF